MSYSFNYIPSQIIYFENIGYAIRVMNIDRAVMALVITLQEE